LLSFRYPGVKVCFYELKMKHQTLRIAAASFSVLAWVVAIAGVIVSIIIGIGATTLLVRVGLVLGGLVFTAIFALVLLTASRLLYLFIDIEDDLREIATLAKKEPKSDR
jgi:hypothetical protein